MRYSVNGPLLLLPPLLFATKRGARFECNVSVTVRELEPRSARCRIVYPRARKLKPAPPVATVLCELPCGDRHYTTSSYAGVPTPPFPSSEVHLEGTGARQARSGSPPLQVLRGCSTPPKRRAR